MSKILIDREAVQQALDALEQMYRRAASEQTQACSDAFLVEMAGQITTPVDVVAELQEVIFIRSTMQMMREAMAAPQPAPVSSRWKLVPIEPTEAMWKAVNRLDDAMAAGGYDGKGCTIEQAWDCLVDAAPEPPEELLTCDKCWQAPPAPQPMANSLESGGIKPGMVL